MADQDFELKGGEGRFCFESPAGYSSFGDFLLFSLKAKGTGPSHRSATEYKEMSIKLLCGIN